MGFVYGDIDYLSLKPAVVDGELGANGETSP